MLFAQLLDKLFVELRLNDAVHLYKLNANYVIFGCSFVVRLLNSAKMFRLFLNNREGVQAKYILY